MKKTFLSIIAIAIAHTSFAQWANGNDIYNTNTGNVGIGTTSPYGKLTVKTTGTSLEFDTDASSGSILSYDRTNSLYKKLGFRGNNFGFLVNDIEKVTIDGNGNVGIGTTTPSSLLAVSGNSPALGTFLTLDDQATTSRTGVRLRFQSNQIAHWNIGIPANVDAFTINGWAVNSNPEFFRINSIGNVGIGTITPDTKLAVNGTIHAKEVKVDMNILPDYVFKPGYDLLTLDEVKRYIDKNQHLPGVPSAEQTGKEGLKLGEMNAVLLKKVEELTLYLLEKDEQLKSDRKDISELKKQVQKLTQQQQK